MVNGRQAYGHDNSERQQYSGYPGRAHLLHHQHPDAVLSRRNIIRGATNSCSLTFLTRRLPYRPSLFYCSIEVATTL